MTDHAKHCGNCEYLDDYMSTFICTFETDEYKGCIGWKEPCENWKKRQHETPAP